MIIAKIIFIVLILFFLINIPFTIYYTNKLMNVITAQDDKKDKEMENS